MQKEIDELRGKKTEFKNDSKVAVFGGFKNFENFEAAERWVYNKLWNEWLPTASDTYNKGEFHGILFCKFDNQEDRDKVVQWFRKSSIQIENESIWSKSDAPLIERIKNSVLFASKVYLTKWGYENKALWADAEKGTLEYHKNGY